MYPSFERLRISDDSEPNLKFVPIFYWIGFMSLEHKNYSKFSLFKMFNLKSLVPSQLYGPYSMAFLSRKHIDMSSKTFWLFFCVALIGAFKCVFSLANFFTWRVKLPKILCPSVICCLPFSCMIRQTSEFSNFSFHHFFKLGEISALKAFQTLTIGPFGVMSAEFGLLGQ